jgi:hypothetical protein
MKSMCKELVRVSQVYEEKGTDEYVKGTNIVLFMDWKKSRPFQRTKW